MEILRADVEESVDQMLDFVSKNQKANSRLKQSFIHLNVAHSMPVHSISKWIFYMFDIINIWSLTEIISCTY